MLLLLAGCAVAAPPAPVIITKVVRVEVPVAAPPPTTIPVAAPPVANVLRDSAKSEAAATSYVHGPHPAPPIIDTLTILTGRVNTAMRALRASRVHGRYGLRQVHRLAVANEVLATFLANKGP